MNRLYDSEGTRNTVEGLTSNSIKQSEASSGSFISVMAIYGTPQDHTLSLHIANSRKQKTGFLTGSYIKPAYQNSESSSMNYRKATQLSTFQ